MKKTDSDFLREALAEAETAAQESEVPVGAVLVHEGKVIGRGRNQREKLQSPLSHAEIHAIGEAAEKLASWRLLDSTLYVTLEPCPMCLAACQQARISRVVYGAQDPKGGAISLGYLLHEDARTHHRFAVEYLPESACGEVLSKFFRQRRNSE